MRFALDFGMTLPALRVIYHSVSVPSEIQLQSLLKSRFGFDAFRPSQEEVCRTVVDGRDVLLVMPTGAGKSLCYQLPGLALGGTTLVISPLIALIDDQVAKLRERGIRAEQIHAGRPRTEARATCQRYLAGELDFLFIAPERLGVPGFPELLSKRKPALITIDEAHCISQWGHDFRPDYRKLGERLRGLRPAPVLALTATATPRVQQDIVAQLGMPRARLCIQGFRRTNIAISAHEVPPSARAEAVATILEETGTPAIIYAPTRRLAEELAQSLAKTPRKDGARGPRAACYHAGLPPEEREQVQTRFLRGELEIIVATVAFGMGIDKADVRTVIHAGLPGSVEAYYQEIGRAGRDGLPSQAVLLHSFADIKTQEFFFERTYPEVVELERVFKKVPTQGAIPSDELQAAAKVSDGDLFERILDKLWAHGGIQIDYGSGDILRGEEGWRPLYLAHRAHRATQLRGMLDFVQSSECRMLYFLRHFGDQSDRQGACGTCDRCAPKTEDGRPLSASERLIVVRTLAALAGESSLAAGKLFESAAKPEQRREFESVLERLAQCRWVSIQRETFSKDGRDIVYRRVELEAAGEAVTEADIDALRMPRTFASSAAASGRKPRKSAAAAKASLPAMGSPLDSALYEKLKGWRLAKSRSEGIPAFRILTDRVLGGLVAARPTSLDDLLHVSGFGVKLRERYGRELLDMISGQGST